MSARSVQLMDRDRDIVEVDRIASALVMIDTIHNRIHNGTMFQTDHLDVALSNNGTIEVLIEVGADEGAHMRFLAKAGGNATMELYESTTVSANGALLASLNRNRFSSTTPNVDCYLSPTITGDGTMLSSILVPGGSGGNAGGGASGTFEEWILKSATNYLLRVTNIAGTTQPIGVEIDWYE